MPMSDDLDGHTFELVCVPGKHFRGYYADSPEGELKYQPDFKPWRGGRDKQYKERHSETIRKKKADWHNRNQPEFDKLRLSRPFVVIDSEGQDYEDNDERRDGVRYKDHGTYLWCASTDDPTKPPHILGSPNASGTHKPKLDVKTILDWLLSLPTRYEALRINRQEQKGAIFVMFGSGYDITQILSQTSLTTARNVVKRADDNGDARDAPEFWGEYAFSYLKGKWFDIWRLRDADRPYKPNGKMDASEHIKIFDTFGYFQKKFEDVVDDMVKRGMADDYDQNLISRMKAKRGKFADEKIEEITEYCLAECRLLSKQMAQLRDMSFQLDLRPKGWHGPGALASAIFTKEKIGGHFGENIKPFIIKDQPQDWAHHAFIGGRIESLKQGYLDKLSSSALLHVYDVSSCYPAAMPDLPSLAPDQGKWTKPSVAELRFDNLAVLLARIEKASPVSMFKVNWNFPTVENGAKVPRHIVEQSERQLWEGSRSTFFPFYPLPYRTKSGSIIFPATGRSICVRDDLISAVKMVAEIRARFSSKGKLQRLAYHV
jgi:hypothetical protein